MVSFPLEIDDPPGPSDAAELALAATIAAEYPGICPPRVTDCQDGCRCRHEAREMLAHRVVN